MAEVHVDGQRQEGKEFVLLDDGKEHEVRVVARRIATEKALAQADQTVASYPSRDRKGAVRQTAPLRSRLRFVR